MSTKTKKPWTPETVSLALERGLPSRSPQDMDGEFPWLMLVPLLGPLLKPIAEGIGERVKSWIAPKSKKGSALMRTMGMGTRNLGFDPSAIYGNGPIADMAAHWLLKKSQGAGLTRTSSQGAIRGRYDFFVPKRGRDTPQPTIASYAPVQQSRSTDRFANTMIDKGIKSLKSISGGQSITPTQEEQLEVIKQELKPYTSDPEAFKGKLEELVANAKGKGLMRTMGKGLKRTSGKGKKKS